MFDVFLSHNSKDKGAVEWIAERLRREAGIEPFLDKWNLIPGEAWQPALEEALQKSTTVAVFIGPSGISPWNHQEVQIALSRAVGSKDEFRVIPVLLPEADPDKVTGFLAQRTWVDFRAGLDHEEPFQRLVTGVRGVARADETFALTEELPPYRGLLKFERQHADRFFGREREIEVLLGKLERSSFQAVVGASGAGKSSLVLAGVLPRTEQFGLWAEPMRRLVLTPGANPLRALANQIVSLLPLGDRIAAADGLEARMAERADGLRTAIETLTARDHGTTVLVIDQMEELFTHTGEKGATRIADFAANLRDAVEGGSGALRVIATLRADFVDRCLQVEPLRAILQDRTFLLGPMAAEGLRDAIARPAAARGALFEKGVVSALLKELEGRPVMLPLLEHALDQLWRSRKGVWLTAEAYEAMGGVSGALKKHADDCWNRLPEADRPVAREALLRLVALGEGVADTRRRVAVEELYMVGPPREQVDRILLALSGPESRLLAADGDQIEVAHEVLIQEWPTLRDWVNEARSKLRTHRRVNEAAREWNEHGRAPGFLLTGARLLEAEEKFGLNRGGLNQLEADLVAASIEARDRQVRLAEEQRLQEARQARRLVEAELEAVRLNERLEEEKRRHELEKAARLTKDLIERGKSLRRWLAVVTSLTVIALLVAFLALGWRAQAQRERGLARSRELAEVALRQLRADPQAALLLIQEAYRASPTESVSEAFIRYESQPERIAIRADTGAVWSAAFSPDGAWVVTAGADGKTRVWDAASRRELGKLEGHRGRVWSAAFSPDGRWMVTAGADETPRVWDAASRRELGELNGHTGWVRSAAFSLDSREVVTAGDDGTARVWDAVRRTELARLKGHTGTVWSAALSSDSRWVATAGNDGTARIWDVAHQKEQAKLEPHAGTVWSAAFSPDAGLVVTAGEDGTARLWDWNAAPPREVGRLEGHTKDAMERTGWVRSAAFSPDGRWVVTAGNDGTARIWDVASRKELVKLEGHTDWVRSAAFSSDGRWVVTAGDDGTTRIWDAASRKELGKLEGHAGAVWSAAFSSDGQRVVTAGDDGTARVWDAALRTELRKLEGHTGTVWGAAFSPDGQRVITAGDDGTVRVWATATGEPVGSFEGHTGWVRSAMFSPDGGLAVTAGDDGSARVWDVASQKQRERLDGHTGPVRSAVFSPDGRWVLTAGEDGTARVWDAANGQQREKLEGHTGIVWSAAFSPDGGLAVTAGEDGTARVWNAAHSKELIKLEGHTGPVRSAMFSPDGQWVVTAACDGTARVWNLASGKELGRLEGSAGKTISSAAFSPDGRWVVTAEDDGTARLWPNWMWKPADDGLLALDAGRGFTCEERRRLLNESTCPSEDAPAAR